MIQTVIDAFRECSLEEYATVENTEKFAKLAVMLTEANEKMNITAITDPRGVAIRHFADSVKAARLIPQGAKVIDVGCGGGFPTLPLAIARPDLEITALDSTAKKLTFVESAAKELRLNVKTLAARAEDIGNDPAHREAYDVCVSRAVARLDVLCELCIPLVRTGGLFIAMKGAAADDELCGAGGAIKALGGKLLDIERFSLPDAGERAIIVTGKISRTSAGYPRQYAKIKKSPLK